VIAIYSYESLTFLLGYESGTSRRITWDNMTAPFIIGGLSSMAACTILFPFGTVVQRMRMKSSSRKEMKKKSIYISKTNVLKEIKYKGTLDTFSKIYQHEGILAFYKGLNASFLKVFPASGIFFLTYELTLNFLKSYKKERIKNSLLSGI